MAADLELTISESLAFGENVTFGVDPQVYVVEELHITDQTGVASRIVIGGLTVHVDEYLALAESPGIDFDLKKSTYDAIAFTETVTISIDNFASLEISDANPHGVSPLQEIYLFEGNSLTNDLEIVDHGDVYAMTALTGDRARLHYHERKEVYAFGGSSSELGYLAYHEHYDQLRMTGNPGQLGELAAVDPMVMQSASFTTPLDTHCSLEIEDHLGSAFFHAAGIAYVHKAVVMNLKTFAVSEYKNFNFDSVVYFNGQFLGINEQGVFILEGDDDLGQYIQARVKSGTQDFGKTAISIPQEAWLAFRSDKRENALQLDIRVDEKTDLYPGRFGGNGKKLREHRTKLGRGVKARFFTWDLKNVSGSWFNMESLRILGSMIKRKAR